MVNYFYWLFVWTEKEYIFVKYIVNIIYLVQYTEKGGKREDKEECNVVTNCKLVGETWLLQKQITIQFKKSNSFSLQVVSLRAPAFYGIFSAHLIARLSFS